MIHVEPHPEGSILSVQAHAGAKRNGLSGERGGILKVSVTQAPEKGKANKAIVAVLGQELSLRKSQIEILSGETSRQKRFLVRDIAADDLARRIELALGNKNS
jgi:hypothetical protein